MSPRYRKPDHVGWVVDEGAVIVMHLGTGEWIGLPDQGAQVWQLLMERGDADEVVEELAQVYGVEPALIAADVGPLLEDLEARELLEKEPS